MASSDSDTSKAVRSLGQLALLGDYARLRQSATRQLVGLRTESGQTPLIVAADAGQWGGRTPWQFAKCVELLLELGSDPLVADASGDTAAHVAARSDNLRLLALLPFDAKFRANPGTGCTPLMEAVRAANWRCAKHLLHLFRQDRHCRQKGRLLTMLRNRQGLTTLEMARASGQIELAEVIETDIRIFDVVLSAQQESVRKELAQLASTSDLPGLRSQANRVNCDLPDTAGRTALWWAVKSATAGVDEVARLLAELGDPTAARADGWSCLHWAARRGRSAAVRELALAGAHVNCRDWSLWTPLMHAAYHNQVGAAKALLEFGANWQLRDIEGRSALELAEHYKSFDVAALLNHFIDRSFFTEPIEQPVDSPATDALLLSNDQMIPSEQDAANEEAEEKSAAYQVTSPPGLCLVISADHASESLGYTMRMRQLDCARIEDVFSGLNFSVKSLANPKCYDIVKLLNSVTGSGDLLQHGCFVCFILAHGASPNSIYDSQGDELEIRDIVTRFRANQCPSLSHKPKLFFIQFYSTPEGQVSDRSHSDSRTQSDPAPLLSQRLDRDFLICYRAGLSSKLESRAHSSHGSPFIQTLCDIIKQRDGHRVDISELIRRLQSRLKTMSTGSDLSSVELNTTLTKKCFLEERHTRRTILTLKDVEPKGRMNLESMGTSYRARGTTATERSADDRSHHSSHSSHSSRSDQYYPRTDPQGFCLIINVSAYDSKSGLESRSGSQADVQRLSDLFHRLRFLVRVLEDCTVEEMSNFLYEEAISKDLARHGCFVCCLMAHCTSKLIFGSDGDSCSIKSLIKRFQASLCRGLAGKPKIFFIQTVNDDWLEDQVDPTPVKSALPFCPTDADFLLCCLTARAFPRTLPEGPDASRGRRNGTDFVQILCDVIENEHASADLMTMMTLVNRKMSDRPISIGRQSYLSSSQVVSLLSRKVSLAPQGGGHPSRRPLTPERRQSRRPATEGNWGGEPESVTRDGSEPPAGNRGGKGESVTREKSRVCRLM